MASEQERLDELLDLTRENTKILRKMRRNMAWSRLFTFLYWMVILGTIGWSYYLLQPYMVKYWGIYQQVMETLNGVQQTGSSFQKEISVLLEKTR